jgi:NosR/NirI family nitrous oxide reductase transcriptional regulator
VKNPIIALLFVLLGGMAAALAQADADARLQAQLRKLFPSATSFSPREGQPPHFKAYTKDSATGQPALAGLAFWTTDLQPLERGYYGPIKMLVGMDIKGILTGVIVVEHKEPYGDFSIDPPAFAAQFTNKNIRDPLRVGDDIDAIATATLTLTSATRAIRNGARRLARQMLAPEGPR